MGDVAERSGVRRQALYEVVGSKDDLVRAILAEKARALRDRVAPVISAERDLGGKLVEGLLFIVADSIGEPYMAGLVGEGELERLSGIVGADELMPRLTGEIWRPVLVEADRRGQLQDGLDLDDVERWMTYLTLMLVGARAQGLSDPEVDRRMIARLLLPALVRS